MGLVDTHMMGLIGTVYQLTPRLQNRRIWPEQLASTEKMLSYSFFKLADMMDHVKLGPEQIWNADETRISTVQKLRNIVAVKRLKQIGSVTSGERGSLVTMCVVVCAARNSVLPIFYLSKARF